jgi:hypothetical protein
MPKHTDIQSILIIGAGPIVIGQACKALKAEGYRVVWNSLEGGSSSAGSRARYSAVRS